MNLMGVSNLNGSARGAACVASLLANSKWLNWLNTMNAFEKSTTNYVWQPINSQLDEVQVRSLGGSYVPIDASTEDQVTGQLYFHGVDIDIDKSIIADSIASGNPLTNWLDGKLLKEWRQFAKLYSALLFNGTGTVPSGKSGKQILGLGKILNKTTTTLPGFPAATRVWDAADFISGSEVSLDLTTSGISSETIGAFNEAMAELTGKVENINTIVMHQTLLSRLTNFMSSQANYAQDSTTWGKPIMTYNGIPIIGLTNEIATNEPDNTATPLTDTSSVWFMNLSEYNTSLVTNSGVDYTEYTGLENKESGKEKFEIRAGWKIENELSLAKLRNVKF